MPEGTSGFVQVPGARLYYQARGTGPILFVIAGGPGNAESFQTVGAFLEPHVVYALRWAKRQSRPSNALRCPLA